MNESQSSSTHLILSIFIGILLVAGSIVLSYMAIDFSRFTTMGYLGVFLATLLGSSTLILPVPNVATVFAAGLFLNPYGVAITGGLGSTIGEMVGYLYGYLFGFGGSLSGKILKWRQTIFNLLEKYGGLAIFLLALIPNPLFDIAGMICGIIHYSFAKFVIATLIGKTVRSFILATLGSAIGT